MWRLKTPTPTNPGTYTSRVRGHNIGVFLKAALTLCSLRARRLAPLPALPHTRHTRPAGASVFSVFPTSVGVPHLGPVPGVRTAVPGIARRAARLPCAPGATFLQAEAGPRLPLGGPAAAGPRGAGRAPCSLLGRLRGGWTSFSGPFAVCGAGVLLPGGHRGVGGRSRSRLATWAALRHFRACRFRPRLFRGSRRRFPAIALPLPLQTGVQTR